MNEEETEIARAFVACALWKWLPGMLGASVTGGVWRVEQADLTALGGAGAGPASIHEVGTWLPDITDPCTRGGILQLVRDPMDDKDLHVRCSRPYVPGYEEVPSWAVYCGRGSRLTARHNDEAEALLWMLQAASEVKT